MIQRRVFGLRQRGANWKLPGMRDVGGVCVVIGLVWRFAQRVESAIGHSQKKAKPEQTGEDDPGPEATLPGVFHCLTWHAHGEALREYHGRDERSNVPVVWTKSRAMISSAHADVIVPL